MSERITAAEFQQMLKGGQITVGRKGKLQGAVNPASKVSAPSAGDRPQEGPRRNKYGAIPQPDPDGGPNFRSTLEAKHAAEYSLMVKAGEIMSFGKQPKVLLDGGITWLIDFIIHHNDGSVEYVDSKGKDTPDFLLKEKLFRAKYPNIKLTIRRAKPGKKKKGAK